MKQEMYTVPQPGETVENRTKVHRLRRNGGYDKLYGWLFCSHPHFVWTGVDGRARTGNAKHPESAYVCGGQGGIWRKLFLRLRPWL